MTLEPKFEVPIYQRQNDGGYLGMIEECNRETEILSGDAKDFILGFTNPEINDNTVAYLMNCTDFPERFNNYSELLRLAYTIYQKIEYREINRFLKENKGKIEGKDKVFLSLFNDGKEKLQCSAENIIAALDVLLENQPKTNQDMIVHRASYLREIFTDIDINEIEDISQLIGRIYTNHGYTSTSPKPITFGKFSDRDTVISIKIPKGTPMLGPISNAGECEVLFGRGYSFKIIGFEKIGSKYHVYVELQPREKELDLKPIDEIKKPELVKGDKYPEALSVRPFGEPQQDIIQFEEERKKEFLTKSKKTQIIEILSNNLEMIKQAFTQYKENYYNLVLQDNMINIDVVIQELNQIINSVQNNEFELDELTNILKKITENQQSFYEIVANTQEEHENRYINACGKRIDFLIRESEIEEIDEKINQLKSKKITLMGRIFGKDKLYEAMIENLKRQKEKIMNTKEEQYSTKEELLAKIVKDIQENGLSERLDVFIKLYCDESYGIATDDERKMLMDLVSNSIPRKKEYAEENIPLLSIRKRTRAIQEETQSIDTGERALPIQYEESQSVRKLMHYLKTELEPYLEERKRATPEQEKNDDELIVE